MSILEMNVMGGVRAMSTILEPNEQQISISSEPLLCFESIEYSDVKVKRLLP
jgi:hypothetical protein